MLSTFEAIKKNIRITPNDVIIDNLISRLHYRATTLILLIATVLVSSRQYIGEHIHCIHDHKEDGKGIPKHVIDTFCFFTTTFTVPRHFNKSMVESGMIPHPGVGTFIEGNDAVMHHAYYQWVPFVLFLQAIFFYIPHYIWKRQEGGRLRKLVSGLQNAHFAVIDKSIQLNNKTVPSISDRDKALNELKKIFIERLHVNKAWSFWFVFCEILNVTNLILQVYITNVFLSGSFYSLGPNLIQQGPDAVDILDIVFPKVTKCVFHKYGASGTIQAHDAMCVMALNIVNEKIYTFLWFWYVFLGTLTLVGLVWRIFTIFLHARSHEFNRMVFATSCPGKLNPWQVLYVTRECHFADWLFLYYLSKNMDGFVFRKLFVDMAESLDEITNPPLLKVDDDDDDEYFHEKAV